MPNWKKVIISGSAADLASLTLDTTLAVAEGGTGVTSKTGTGNVVLSSSPTLVTPRLGTPVDCVATNLTGTAANLTAGTATVANVATTVTITDNESTDEINAIIFTAGGDIDGGNLGLESDGDLTYIPGSGTVTATIFKGNIDAVDGDFDGTLEADAITVDGTTLAEYIADTVGGMLSGNTETNITTTYQDADNTVDLVIGTLNQNTTGNAATATALESARTIGGTSFDGTANITPANATLAATVTATANNSTNESNYITFIDGASGAQGIETDTGLRFNPSSNTLTATTFTGALNGNAQTATTATTCTTATRLALGGETTLTVTQNEENGALVFSNGEVTWTVQADEG